MEEWSVQRRVKVYRLNAEGGWDDNGTGFVSLKPIDKHASMGIVVQSEAADTGVILESKISAEDIYQRQQDTLIVWNEPSDDEDGIDLAISFQEPQGCTEIWDQLMEIQAKMSKSAFIDFDDILGARSQDFLELESSANSIDLPPPNLKYLDQIVKIFQDPTSNSAKDRLANAVLKENYVKKMLELFNDVEDLEDTEDLHKIYEVFKSMMMLNNNHLLEVLFSPEYVLDVMGALEYDPELKRKMNHREFLTNMVKFKQVVPFTNPTIIEKIHQTFRMHYVKDVVLPRTLDEYTFAQISSLIYMNNIYIVSHLIDDNEFLKQLFSKMKKAETSNEDFLDLLRFLQELCDLSKSLDMKGKMLFFNTLTGKGVFEVLQKALTKDDPKTRSIAVEVIYFITEHDSSLLRAHILMQESKEMFKLLIKVLTQDAEAGLKNIVTDVIRFLLDTENKEFDMRSFNKPADNSVQKNDFVNLFYTGYVKTIFEPLEREVPKTLHSEAEGLTKYNLLELLSFIAAKHGYRSKYFLLNSYIMGKALNLLRSKDKYLALGALRSLRALVATKDKFLIKHIVKEDLFRPVVKSFDENGPRYNLMNSAIVELFEYIRQENIKPLIAYFVENFYKQFEGVDYVNTFKNLKIKYDQNEHVEAPAPDAGSNRSARRKVNEDDEDEEAYFDRDDDEEEDEDKKEDKESKTPPLVSYTEDEAETSKNGSAAEAKEEPAPSPSRKRKEVESEEDNDDRPLKKLKTSPVNGEHEEGTKNNDSSVV